MSLLYEAECKEQTPADVLHGLPVEPDAFVVDLVQGVARVLAGTTVVPQALRDLAAQLRAALAQ